MEITKKARTEDINNEHPESESTAPKNEYIRLDRSIIESWIDKLSFEDLLDDYPYNTETNKNPIFGSEEVKNYALEKLHNISCSGYENGGTALHEFVKKRNLTCIQFLLNSNDINKNAFDTNGKTALNYAFEAPIDIAIIKTLIGKGCDINIAFTDSNKLFTVDVLKNIECVKYLVDDVKFDVEKYEIGDYTKHPVLTAVSNNITEAFDLLTAKMPTSRRFKWKTGEADLVTICAKELGKRWLIERIIEKHPKDSFTSQITYYIGKDKKIHSAHIYDVAIHHKNTMFVEELLKRGDSLNHFNSIGFHPLHTAVKYNNLEVIRLISNHKEKLLNFDIDVMTKNESKVTALYMAVFNGNLEMCNELLKMGANPNAHIQGTSILHVEVLMNRDSSKLLDLLLKYGANPNYRDRNLRLPSDYAYSLRNGTVTKVFKAMFNKPNYFHTKPLPTIGENGKMLFGEIINLSGNEKN